MAEALRGKVKWFNNAKGFGFIENSDGDVFVHYSVIESDGFRSLKDGDEVNYEIQRGPKGLQAVKVSKSKSDTDIDADSSAESLIEDSSTPTASPSFLESSTSSNLTTEETSSTISATSKDTEH